MLIIDFRGLFRFATPDILHFAGYKVNEVLGISVKTLVPDEAWQALRTRWIELVQNHKLDTTYYIETLVKRRDQTIFPVNLELTRLPDQEAFLVMVQSERSGRIISQFNALQSTIAAVSGHDTSKVATLVVDQIIQLIRCDGVSIAIETKENFEVLHLRYLSEQSQPIYQYPGDQVYKATTTTLMKQTHQPLIINDCLHDARWTVISPALNVQSWLGVPILYQDNFMGIFEFFAHTPFNFSEDDAGLAMHFAQGIAVAVYNTRTYRELQLHTQRLGVMYDITSAMGNLEIEAVLEVIYAKLSELIDTRTFYIGLFNPETRELRLKNVYDKGQRLPDEVSIISERSGLVGWVINHPQTIIINDLANEKPVQTPIYYGDIPRNVVIVPLIFHQETMGVISVQSYEPAQFNAEDVALLEAVAGPTASIIKNTQLLQQLFQRATELEKAYEDLQVAHNLRVELVHNITHDLRSPLSLIRGYTDLLIDGAFDSLNEDQLSALHIITTKIDFINRLIEDMLSIKRIRQDTLRKERMDINEMVRQAIEEARIAQAKKDFVFESVPYPTPLIVHVDLDRIYRVFDNLIGNAVKFSQTNGKLQISVHCAADQQQVEIKIQDNGIGIPPDKLPHIFEHFYQVHQSAREEKQNDRGVGLGLAIVHQIVEAHGGTIEVSSTEGVGTTFCIQLPLER